MHDLETLFHNASILAHQHRVALNKLNHALIEKYGISYNDTDDSLIIDALDYNFGDMTFEEFTQRMEHYSNTPDIPFDAR